jgi:hypothetical protein
MTSNLEKDISDILTGTHTKTSDEVSAVLEQVKAEIPSIETELAANVAAEEDMTITGPALEEAIQRTSVTRRHLNRLKGSMSRLTASRDALILAERDERQKAAYALLKKQRAAAKAELAVLIERIPSFARLLHRVVELEKEADRFNNPPNPRSGMPINPQDNMVSKYEHLPPLMSDAMRKGLRLIDADGTVLYAHVDIATSGVRPTVLPASTHVNFGPEKEALQRAMEQQPHAKAILRGLEHEVEARGISLEQAALNEGLSAKDVERYQEQADGKHVEAAYAALMAAHEAFKESEKATS